MTIISYRHQTRSVDESNVVVAVAVVLEHISIPVPSRHLNGIAGIGKVVRIPALVGGCNLHLRTCWMDDVIVNLAKLHILERSALLAEALQSLNRLHLRPKHLHALITRTSVHAHAFLALHLGSEHLLALRDLWQAPLPCSLFPCRLRPPEQFLTLLV